MGRVKKKHFRKMITKRSTFCQNLVYHRHFLSLKNENEETVNGIFERHDQKLISKLTLLTKIKIN